LVVYCWLPERQQQLRKIHRRKRRQNEQQRQTLRSFSGLAKRR
jgi:hypothetical protein